MIEINKTNCENLPIKRNKQPPNQNILESSTAIKELKGVPRSYIETSIIEDRASVSIKKAQGLYREYAKLLDGSFLDALEVTETRKSFIPEEINYVRRSHMYGKLNGEYDCAKYFDKKNNNTWQVYSKDGVKKLAVLEQGPSLRLVEFNEVGKPIYAKEYEIATKKYKGFLPYGPEKFSKGAMDIPVLSKDNKYFKLVTFAREPKEVTYGAKKGLENEIRYMNYTFATDFHVGSHIPSKEIEVHKPISGCKETYTIDYKAPDGKSLGRDIIGKDGHRAGKAINGKVILFSETPAFEESGCRTAECAMEGFNKRVSKYKHETSKLCDIKSRKITSTTLMGNKTTTQSLERSCKKATPVIKKLKNLFTNFIKKVKI